MDSDYPTCIPHILLETTRYPQPTPSRHRIAAWQGPQFPHQSQRLRGFPLPALSSDYPGKWGPEWAPWPSLSLPAARWPLVPTTFRFHYSKLPSFPDLCPTCSDKAGAVSLVSRLSAPSTPGAPRHKHLNLHGPSLWWPKSLPH